MTGIKKRLVSQYETFTFHPQISIEEVRYTVAVLEQTFWRPTECTGKPLKLKNWLKLCETLNVPKGNNEQINF